MDIARLSMAMSTSALQEQVSIKMLSKAIDLSSVLGQGLEEMVDAAAMELSVNPAVGGNIDVRV